MKRYFTPALDLLAFAATGFVVGAAIGRDEGALNIGICVLAFVFWGAVFIRDLRRL